MIYYPIKNEISLLDLVADSDKNFYFPVIKNNNIFPVSFNKNLGFKSGKFGIFEPVGDALGDFSSIDLILIPALAADYNGNRLGYGCGFYDRFLKCCDISCIKVIPIFSKLLFENIPTDDWDIPVDYIISESGIIKI